MLQPEPLSEANLHTVTPLLQSAGNHVNSVGEGDMWTLRKSKLNLFLFYLPLLLLVWTLCIRVLCHDAGWGDV